MTLQTQRIDAPAQTRFFRRSIHITAPYHCTASTHLQHRDKTRIKNLAFFTQSIEVHTLRVASKNGFQRFVRNMRCLHVPVKTNMPINGSFHTKHAICSI